MSQSRRKLIVTAVGVVFLGVALMLISNEHVARAFGSVWLHVRDVLSMPLFDLGKQPLSTLSIIKVCVFLGMLGLFANYSMSFLEKRLLVHTRLEPGQRYAMARVVSYVVFALGLVVGLEATGLNLSSLVVLGGALGLGVGLGLQTVVSNFVAGLILLLEQPVRVGDRIEVGDTFGDVVAMRGRSTWVRTNDNVVIIVPNSNFIEKSVTNWTANDRRVRVSLDLGVSYEADPVAVREALLKVAAENASVLADPAPDVIFKNFGDSSLDFQLRVWTEQMVHIPGVLRSDLYFAVFEEFRRRQIEIPFPQRDLHVRSVSDSAAAALSAAVRA